MRAAAGAAGMPTVLLATAAAGLALAAIDTAAALAPLDAAVPALAARDAAVPALFVHDITAPLLVGVPRPTARRLLWLATDAALGCWLGSIVFFSFVGAPTTFAVLPREEAGRVVRAVFPRYYDLGLALGVLAVAAAAVRGLWWGFPVALLALVAAAAVAVGLFAYARWVLLPRMDRADDDAFARYHRRAVVANGAAMVAVAVGLVASQFSPPVVIAL